MGHRFGMPMAIGSIVVAFFMVTQCCLVYDGPNEVAHQLRPRGPVVMILVLPTFAVAIYLSLVEQSLVFYEESLSSTSIGMYKRPTSLGFSQSPVTWSGCA